MILVFLVLFAWLAWAILAELDVKNDVPALAGGECPGCHQAVAEDWLLCPRCRTLLQATCRNCGRPSDSRRPFCPWCGRRHAAEAS